MPPDGDDAHADPARGGEPRLHLRADDLAVRAFEHETVVLDLRSSTYMSTNPAGTVLWTALQAGTTRSELVAALTEHFDVDVDRAGADVDAFIDDCRRRQLLAE